MRVVFMGTPPPAAAALEALAGSPHEILAVLTQPDRPRGRSKSPQAPAAKEAAVRLGLRVEQPPTPNAIDVVALLRSLEPDVLAVVAYGHILKPDVLGVAPAVNVHFSLLPRYRGAAPVQRAIAGGETVTGVSTFLLEPAVDTGPVLMQRSVAIGEEETAGELLDRLAPIGADLLLETLAALEAGTAEPVPQDPSTACPAPKVSTEEARIDWTQPAGRVCDLVRAFNPQPGAWTTFRGKRLGVWRARPAASSLEPGAVAVEAGRLLAGAGDGSVELVEVQMEGKRRTSGEDFARGYRPEAGERLGDPT